MNSNIHAIIKEYLEPIVEDLSDTVLQFNWSPEAPGSISFVTQFSDRTTRRFVNGDEEKAYGFALVIVKEYSTETDDVNMEAMAFADQFSDWIQAQNKAKNFPDLGEDMDVLTIESLQNMANLATVNAEEGLARYQLQGRITYIQHADEW